MPEIMPAKKILAIDIGGTLAKAAFYMPGEHRQKLDQKGLY